MFEEFIAHELQQRGGNYPEFKALKKTALLHGHCHQKAFDVMNSVVQTLALVPGLEVKQIESACCGMAGAFGYAADTIDVSRQMAALDLLPAIEQAEDSTMVVADGTSCRHQIDDLALRKQGRSALHVARVLEIALA